MEKFQVIYHPRVLREDLPKLDRVVGERIASAIEKKLLVDPLHFSYPLRKTLYGLFKLRVGNYRVIFAFQSQRTLYIVGIQHRSIVYKEITKRVE